MQGMQWDRSYNSSPDILKGMAASGDVRQMFRERTLVGTPEQVAERIARYRDLGFNEIGVMGRYTSISHKQCLEVMQRLSEDVMPLLA